MGVKERYENRQKTIKEKDDNKSNIGVAQRYEMKKFSDSLPSRLENLTSAQNELRKNYISRFTDKDGNYINAYRGDTGEALTKFETSKTDLDNETKAILEGFSKYGQYLDADKVKEIQDYLSTGSGDLNSMYETYRTDHDYYSQWSDEDSYNRAMSYAKEQEEKKKKYSSMTDEELSEAKKKLEGPSVEESFADFLENTVDVVKESQENGFSLGSLVDAVGGKVKGKVERTVDDAVLKTANALEGLGLGNAEEIAATITSKGQYDPNEAAKKAEADKYDLSLIKEEQANRVYKKIDGLPDDVKVLMDEYAELDRESEKAEIDHAARVYADAWTNSNNSSFLTLPDNQNIPDNSFDERKREIREQLESYGIEDLDRLLQYNAIRYGKDIYEAETEEYKDIAKEAPALSSALSVIMSPGKALGSIYSSGDAIGNVINGEDLPLNPYSPYFDTNNLVNSTRDEVMENYDWKFNEEGRDWFDTLYGVGMSSGDSLIGGIASGGTLLGGGGLKGASALLGGPLLGASTWSDSAQEVGFNGGSSKDAFLTGLTAGLNEMLWESVSLGKLDDLISNGVSKRGFKGAIKEVLKSAGINASEEFNTEAANLISDYLINGGASAYAESVQAYLSQGYTEEEAKHKAQQDMVKQMGEAGFSGALQGLLMGGGGTAIGTASLRHDENVQKNASFTRYGTSIINNNNVEDLIKTAESLGGSGKSLQKINKLIKAVSGADINSMSQKQKALYTRQVGELYNAIVAAQAQKANNLTEKGVTLSFKDMVKAELSESGLTENIDGVADAFVKYVNGDKLTRAELKTVQSLNADKIIEGIKSKTEYQQQLNNEIEASENDVISTIGYALKPETTATDAEIKRLEDATGYTVSQDGKTRMESTDEEVNIQSIASFDGDDVSVNLDNGETVSAAELNLNSDYATIFSGLSDLSKEGVLDTSTANLILHSYKGLDISSYDYILGAMDSVRYGNIGAERYLGENTFAKKLPQSLRKQIYKNAREFAIEKAKEKTKAITDKRNTKQARKKGSVKFDGISYETLNKSQKAQVDAISVIMSELGVNVEFFASKIVNGKRQGVNGSYNPVTNTIRLDVFAGYNGEGLIFFTASHELTHFISKWSPEKFKVFSEILLQKYMEKDVPVNTLVTERIKQSELAADKDPSRKVLSFGEAYEEVVCDACEAFLRDSNAKDTLIALAETDRGVLNKVISWIKDFKKALQNALNSLKGINPQSRESAHILNMAKEDIQSLQDLWDEALLDSMDNYQNYEAEKNTTDEGDVRYSIKKTSKMAYATQIEQIENQQLNGSNSLYIGVPSAQLQSAGFSNNPFAMNQSDYRKSRRKSAPNKNYSKHAVKKMFFEQLPKKLNEAVMFIDNGKKVTIVTDSLMIDTAGKPSYIVAGVWKNQPMDDGYINQIKSVYPLDDFINRITESAESGNLVILNKNKANDLLAPIGIQPSQRSRIIDLAKDSISQYSEKSSGSDTQNRKSYKITDSEYLSAIENGDTETAQRLVDEAAKRAGYQYKLYHQTSNDFTVFNVEHKGSGTGDYETPFGIFMKPSNNDIGLKGSKQMPLYANISNPLIAKDRDDLIHKLKKYNNVTSIQDKINETNDEYKSKVEQTGKDLQSYLIEYREAHPDEPRKNIYQDEKFNEIWEKESDLITKWTKTIDEISLSSKYTITEALKNDGYDGVIIDYDKGSFGRSTKTYIALENTQVKSADPVTYDNEGKVIPLSERFNESNNDIRYQDRFNGQSDIEKNNKKSYNKNSYYNEFNTLAMQWAYAPGTKTGDLKMLPRKNKWVLIESIEDGFIELYSGTYKEMKHLEQTYRNATDSLYGHIEAFRAGERRDTWDLFSAEDRGYDDRDGEQAGSQRLQVDSERNDEHLRSSDKRESVSEELLFQERPISDREILVDAMSNSEGLTIEDKNRLEIYRGKIDNINKLENELADVGKQIHEIINTKGSDRKQLNSLYVKADNLRKMISRVDGELLKIEAMEPIQKLVEIRKKQAIKAQKQRAQEQRKKNVEGRKKTAAKNKIKRVVKTLESLYGNPTKEKNVKIEFQDMVRTALAMSDVLFNDYNAKMSVNDILAGEITTRLSEKDKENLEEWRKKQKEKEGYQQELEALEFSEEVDPETYDELLGKISECNKKLNVLGRSLSDVVERQRAEWNETVVQYAIDSLVDAYKSLDESTETYAKAAYNDYVAKRLDTLKTSLKNTTVKTMTLTQLEEVYQAYKMVLTTIRTANELFVDNKRMSVTDMGEKVIAEIEEIAKPTDHKIAALKGVREFSWEELIPVYAFERIGSDTFMRIYKEIRRGQDVVARDIAEAQAFFRKMSETYGYDSWDFKERKDFKLSDGRIFRINLEEIMSIYAYSRRGKQALDHITEGGFVYDNKKFFTDTKEGGVKGWLEGKVKKERTTVEAYRLNDDVFYKITNSLTEEQKRFAEKMQDYLTLMGKKGNEVSRVLYGIDLFNEEHYFPLMSSDAFSQQTKTSVGEVSLKNSGMTKATVPNADNPIVLQGFMDVWNGHVNKMSTYHGLVLPIENLNKVFNYTGYARDNRSVSVKTVLAGAYGNEVNKYIKNFITDLNGGIKVQSSSNGAMKRINKFKKTAVAASTSVTVQQPTAILRSMAMISPKYFVHKTDGLKHNEAWEELKKYAPVAIIKEMGGFDVGGGRQVDDYISKKTYKGKDKVNGLLHDRAYRKEAIDDALMWGATKADEFGWITIWNAVKKEIEDTTTYNVDSEEFLNACGERFTEVVDYTQVYDSVLSRSGFMRNKGEISKMATSFMGEPTKSYNMLYNAVLQTKRGKMSKSQSAKIIGATYGSIILAAVAKSFIYALRDDDEDEAYDEKYFQALTSSLMSDIFIHNMLPFISDITSLLSGWDVERTDMAIIKDVVNAFNDIDSSSKSTYRKIEDLAGAMAALGGVPLKNIMRTGREMYNLVSNILDGNTLSESDVGGAVVETLEEAFYGNLIVEKITGGYTGGNSVSDINILLEKGDTDKAKKIVNDLIEEKVAEGKTVKEAKASVKASLTSYWKPIYLEAYKDGDSAKMLKIRRNLSSLGVYDSVADTTSDWIKSLSKDNKESETTSVFAEKW